jgi:hypothetical protein
LLDGPHQRVFSNYLGEIEQGTGDRGDGNASDAGPIVGIEIPNQVDGDAATATATAPASRHIDQVTVARPDPPQGCGALVTQNSVTAAGEHGCHQSAEFGDICMADRIYASVQAVQSHRPQPVLNGGAAESQRDELLMRNDAMLSTR